MMPTVGFDRGATLHKVKTYAYKWGYGVHKELQMKPLDLAICVFKLIGWKGPEKAPVKYHRSRL
jgi:hypothetical protein